MQAALDPREPTRASPVPEDPSSDPSPEAIEETTSVPKVKMQAATFPVAAQRTS